MKVRDRAVRVVGAMGVIALVAGCGGQIAGTPTRLGLAPAVGDNSGPGSFLPPPSRLPEVSVPNTVPGTTAPVPSPTDAAAPPSDPALPSAAAPGVPTDNTLGPDATGGFSAPPNAGPPSAALPSDPGAGTAGPVTTDPAVKALADRIAAAQGKVTTAHVTAVIDIGALKETFDSHVQDKDGSMVAMSANMTVTTGGQSIPVEIRLVNGDLYLSGATFLSSVGVMDKHWLLAKPTSSNGAVADFARTFSNSARLTPAGQSSALAASASGVTDLGATVVNGVSAHHYSMQVDPARAAAALNGPESAAAAAPGGPAVPVEIWLDSSDRVVKMIESVAQSGQTLHLELTSDSFDQPVTITAPDAADVATR